MHTNQHKNRLGISILVVEKNINPLECEDTRHDLTRIPYFLKRQGFKVDLTWSVGNYKFDDFDEFNKLIINNIKKRMETFEGEKWNELREIFQRMNDQEVEKFKDTYDLLRKKAINNIDDLSEYDLLIMHPDFEDCDKYLKKIRAKYPDKPLIFPVGSIAASCYETHARNSKNKFPIEDAYKDPRYDNIYCLHTEWDFDYKIIELIEHILDNKE